MTVHKGLSYENNSKDSLVSLLKMLYVFCSGLLVSCLLLFFFYSIPQLDFPACVLDEPKEITEESLVRMSNFS